MKKVIVTGGAGFIGSNLVDALIENSGYEVHVIDDLSKGVITNVNPKATFHKADIRDLDKIKSLFEGVYGVFHLAAHPEVQYSIEHPVETNEINVNGTMNVLIAAQEAGVKKIVYSASGGSVYGDSDVFPANEKVIPKPKSPYALQKYIGEHLVRLWHELHGMQAVSLRYFNVYGPRQREDGAYALVIAKFLKQKRERKSMTITGTGEATRDFVHVRDVVRANILAMESDKVGKGESINIGGGKERSVLEIAQMLGGDVVHIEARIEPKRSLADISLAKELLGWEPQEDFEKGIEELKNN